MAMIKYKTKRHFMDRNEGFSLVEVMIAITFLGIGLLAIGQLVPAGMAGISQARVRTSAVQAAQMRVDDLQAEDFTAAALTAGTYTETVGNYTLTWTIIDNTPVPGSKRINLIASWPALTGTKTARLTTFVTANQ
jgi:prepilin-type N-terminal cleavage/methylation domain-containing protein